MTGFSSPYRYKDKWAVVYISNGLACGNPHLFGSEKEAADFVANPGTVDTESPPEWIDHNGDTRTA